MIYPDTAHMSEDEMGQKHKKVPACKRRGPLFIQMCQDAMQPEAPMEVKSD